MYFVITMMKLENLSRGKLDTSWPLRQVKVQTNRQAWNHTFIIQRIIRVNQDAKIFWVGWEKKAIFIWRLEISLCILVCGGLDPLSSPL